MINPASETWRGVHEHAITEIDAATRRIIRANCSHDEANRLRGRIAALQDLLRLAEPKEGVSDSPVTY